MYVYNGTVVAAKSQTNEVVNSPKNAKAVISLPKFAPAWLPSSPWPTLSVSMPTSPPSLAVPASVLPKAWQTAATRTPNTSSVSKKYIAML